jgi:hypothetical protein
MSVTTIRQDLTIQKTLFFSYLYSYLCHSAGSPRLLSVTFFVSGAIKSLNSNYIKQGELPRNVCLHYSIIQLNISDGVFAITNDSLASHKSARVMSRCLQSVMINTFSVSKNKINETMSLK